LIQNYEKVVITNLKVNFIPETLCYWMSLGGYRIIFWES